MPDQKRYLPTTLTGGVTVSSGTVNTIPPTSSSSSVTSVAASASNVTLLASNTSRLGATVYNDSASATLSLKLGATASATSFTAQVDPGGYYEVPFSYTGIIDGIWSAAVGSARITELT